MGQSPSSEFYNVEGDGVEFLQGCSEFGSFSPESVLFCSKPAKIAPAGSVLFSVRAPVGRVNFADKEYCIGRGVAALDPVKIDNRYLYHFLRSQEGRYNAITQGTTFEAINSRQLTELELHVPENRQQQSAIADVLTTIDDAIARTEALIAKHKRVRAGLLQDLLTKGIDENGVIRSEETHRFKDSPLGRIPVEWEVQELSHAVPSAEYGISEALNDNVAGVPVLRMNNLRDGEVDTHDLKYSESVHARSLTLEPLDVLFNRTNSMEHVGRTAIWRGQLSIASFASYLVRLIPDRSRIDSEFLSLWLNWPNTQNAIRRYATSAVHQVNINPTNLRKTLIALPVDISEQERIVSTVRLQNNQINQENCSLEKLQRIKTGLMQDLLTGRVSVEPLLAGAEG